MIGTSLYSISLQTGIDHQIDKIKLFAQLNATNTTIPQHQQEQSTQENSYLRPAWVALIPSHAMGRTNFVDVTAHIPT